MKIEKIKELILSYKGEFTLRELDNDIARGNLMDSFNVVCAFEELYNNGEINASDISGDEDNWEYEWKFKVGKCEVLKF